MCRLNRVFAAGVNSTQVANLRQHKRFCTVMKAKVSPCNCAGSPDPSLLARSFAARQILRCSPDPSLLARSFAACQILRCSHIMAFNCHLGHHMNFELWRRLRLDQANVQTCQSHRCSHEWHPKIVSITITNCRQTQGTVRNSHTTIQGRRRLLESGTAIEHRWCSPSASSTRRERTRGGLIPSLVRGGPPPRKFCNSRWLKKLFCCTLRPFLLVNLSLFTCSIAIFKCLPQPLSTATPPTNTKISTTISTARLVSSGSGIKLTDSSKFKVTVKSVTDILALLFCLFFICLFCSFSFFFLFFYHFFFLLFLSFLSFLSYFVSFH